MAMSPATSSSSSSSSSSSTTPMRTVTHTTSCIGRMVKSTGETSIAWMENTGDFMMFDVSPVATVTTLATLGITQGGLATGGFALGLTTGPAAPIAAPIGGLVGLIVGAVVGAAVTQNIMRPKFEYRAAKERMTPEDRARIDSEIRARINDESTTCPISQEIMNDPVRTPAGIVMERSQLQAWFAKGNRTCPVSGVPLRPEECRTDLAMLGILRKKSAVAAASEAASGGANAMYFKIFSDDQNRAAVLYHKKAEDHLRAESAAGRIPPSMLYMRMAELTQLMEGTPTVATTPAARAESKDESKSESTTVR